MKINVKFYASFRGPVGADSIELEILEGTIIGLLVERLQADYPGLKGFENAIIAVNGKHQNDDWVLLDGDVVAVMPPIAGG
jgi:MoaD family protein